MRFARVVGPVALCGGLALAGCSSGSPAAPPSPSARAALRPAADLCARVDTASLASALGTLLTSKAEPPTADGLVSVQTCDYQFGRPAARIPVEVSIQFSADGGSVADYYQGLRGVAQRDGPVTPVPGLGQDAYRFTNGIGPHLVTYHGNLYLTYAVVTGALQAGQVPSGIDAAEVASARATMARLIP